MYATLGRIFDQTVGQYPDREALVDIRRGKRWTYSQWSDEVHRLANALTSAGVSRGDRVSSFLFNNSELPTTLFACAKIGAIFNPINFRLKPEELVYILNDATPEVVLFEEALKDTIKRVAAQFPSIQFWFIDSDVPEYAVSYQEQVSAAPPTDPFVQVDEMDTYAIMYTSGTTGRPKGVIHRHRDMAEQSMTCIAMLKYTKNDVGLVIAPMFHCAELHCCVIPRVQAGASSVIMHQFDPQAAVETVEKEKVTVMFAVPTMWSVMADLDGADAKVKTLQRGLYGAAPMAPILVKWVKEVLGIELIQAYGQTEMGPAITFLAEDEQLTKAGSAGKPAFNHEIRIVRPNEKGPSEPDDRVGAFEVGEIIVRGPSMMAGYFHRPQATSRVLYKGWYHTSDLGYVDEDGYLFVADRVDDMIISGGENIYPREVEDVLHEHELIQDVAVLGIPDEKWGEAVMAFIVVKDALLTEQQLEEFCVNHDKLARFKRPRNYRFVDELPRNASGKIQKFLLRELYAKNKA
ncbi:long-chain fatty acid--CoA ligase [Planococcus antarcticus DSM 14505]|uniref:Long-chain fatty acid--CoA ligase n=1 Tax=Planococcus antarcticus DSM 14505 TaxID=1185653 RepID=A0ABM6D152_9BACL|nr:fatty acid--CoA ligase [Planococcus antarcticus]ANU09073.1 long-chain fatty acid--CoA ligase [Planococcus antarcticus DSM 14505]